MTPCGATSLRQEAIMSAPPTHGTATSADGTAIAWTRRGSGPPLVMVHCVSVSRATTPQPTLPGALAQHFTVWTYDRRGNGDSGNTGPYAVEREFEDLAAIIALAGAPVTVYGFSSGATLALLATAAGADIAHLTLLEPPLLADDDPDLALRGRFERIAAEDGIAAAHSWFTTTVVGVPEEVAAQMPELGEEDLANTPTIAHELTFLPGTPAQRFSPVSVPTLLIASDQTDPRMHEYADALAGAMPRASVSVLSGQWHGVDDATLTRAIVGFVPVEA